MSIWAGIFLIWGIKMFPWFSLFYFTNKISLPQPGISNFTRNPGSFQWMTLCRNQDLGIGWAPWYQAVLLPGHLSGWSWETCVCTQCEYICKYVHPCLCHLLYIYLSAYWSEIWVHINNVGFQSNTTEFALLSPFPYLSLLPIIFGMFAYWSSVLCA